MNAQFLSSFTFKKITLTNFRQTISLEDFQRLNKAINPYLTCETPFQIAPTPVLGHSKVSQAQSEETGSTKPILRFSNVDGLEKAEYQEESDRGSNDIKTEPHHSEENKMGWIKQEVRVKFEGFGRSSETTSKSETVFPHQDLITDKLVMPTLAESLNLSEYLRKELEHMVSFILHNMGKVTQTEIENMKQRFSNNQCLLQIYDKLVIKYFSARRCREDIVRYILRRAFREVRIPIMKEEKLSNKKASLAVCKKYFQKAFEELEKSGRDIENEDELLELVMPYTKKSKNRTMNTNFVHEVFASKEFAEDYQTFLGQFSEILEEDNSRKIEQLLEFLMDCIKKDALDKIGKYKRFPWLDTWIEQTKDIAFSLPKCKKKGQKHRFKKVKV